MIRNIDRFSKSRYDVLVIGGGINGAAIAHIASAEGLRVALVDKGDFACGTSSKSTKLLHGGIRYLENFEFGLVKESLKERFIQRQFAPHLTNPIPFIIPVYKNDTRPLWMMKVGVFLYDLFSGEYSLGKHRHLDVNELGTLEPNLKMDELLGGVMYYDAQMDDARLCLENIIKADQHGAHVANYVEIVQFVKEDDKVIGVHAKDVLSQRKIEILAKHTVCAVGPWTNALLKLDHPYCKKKIRTTKGIHIVYQKKLTEHAVLISSRQDNRIFFVIPWHEHSLIGTTDTNFIQNPDTVEASQKDIDYLLKEAQRVFPKINFKKEHIIRTFAGLRPLVRHGGSPSKVSRKHVIDQTDSGLIYVIGGKYTTYRVIASECVQKITDKIIHNGSHLDLFLKSKRFKGNSENIAKNYGIDVEIINHLRNVYGERTLEVLELTKKDQKLKEKICDCSLTIAAQVVYAIETEMAIKKEDIIQRRLVLGYLHCSTGHCRKEISKILDKYKG